MEELVGRLKELWASLKPWQKVVVLGVPAVLVVGAVAAIALALGAPPVQAPLYRDLEMADAARVVDQLKKDKVEYTLENEGKDILVPSDQVYDLRLELAQMGLPQNNIGFELFDKTKLGVTEAGMKIDFQRALQGELARTLESLEPVDKANVLLNISPETSFLDSDTHSTASVTLQLKPGQRLNQSQVEGVRHLVGNAVPRLNKDDVSIVDGSGTPLTGKEQDEDTTKQLAGMQLTDLQQKFRGMIERNLENKIRSVLEGPYGAGKVSPSVSVDIDFRAIHNEHEIYTPVVGDEGIEKRVEEHREKSTGTGAEQGGVPGTTSNIPGYLGISGTENRQEEEKSKYDLLVDYLVNKKVSLEDLPPGTITRRSAAVAISTPSWDANAKQSIESLVASAIGADIAKGDRVEVQAFSFNDTETAAVTQQYVQQQSARNMSRLAGWLMALVMVIVLALMLRSIVGSVMGKEDGALLATAGEGGKRAVLSKEEEEEEYALKRLDELTATAQTKMRYEINRMIDRQPDQVLSLVRSWMLEDT